MARSSCETAPAGPSVTSRDGAREGVGVPSETSDGPTAGAVLPSLVVQALDALPGSTVIVVDRDGRVLLCRGARRASTGIRGDDLEGRPVREVADEAGWALLEPSLAAALDGRTTTVEVPAPDGSRTFRLVVAPFTAGDGEVAGAVALVVEDTEVRRAHEALVASEERFRLLAENSSDMVMRTTADGIIEWVSASVTETLGWRPDELVGRHSLDFAHPDVRSAVATQVGEVNRGGTVSGRLQVLHKDGSYRWMSRTLRPVRGPDGEVVARVSGWRDIEAEVAAERALIQSEEMFRLAMDAATIGMFVAGIDRTFVRVNPALCTMLGREAEVLHGITFEDVTHPDDIELSREAMKGITRGLRDTAHLRKRYVRPDGGVVWGDTSVVIVRDQEGRPRHILGQVIDVSVEVANFEAMQRAAADLRLLAENASDVVLRINEHGVITWVSPSVRTVLGWEPDVLVGTPSLSLIEHADHERVLAGRVAMRDGGQAQTMVVRYRSTSGEARDMSGTMRPLRDERGRFLGGIIGLRDVTEEQAMRRELDYRATHDALTGLSNREDLLGRLRQRLASPMRDRHPLGVLFLDVDNLKSANDEHGHHVGDAVLIETAQRLSATVRREDLVARLSGDEFVVVVDTVEGLDGLRRVAGKCCEAAAGPVHVPDPDADGEVVVVISVSVGAVLASPEESAEQVLRRADRAVYRAKHAGRNQVHVDTWIG